MNGKILSFVKEHWFGCLSVLVVSAAILVGVHSCSQRPPVSVDANRNRVVIQLPNFK